MTVLTGAADRLRRGAITVFVVLCSVLPAAAHHSFEAEFDSGKPVTLRGTVTKFDFINPHGWIYVEVKDADGKNSKWGVETGNPSMLLRLGWKKTSLKPGDQVVIEGYSAKDGSNTANGREVRFADGTRLFAGSSAGRGPVSK